ncbi:MAG: hypothetical protein IPH80_30375 [Myxococcales bacterium]|nr:hypothetical protein [Myxococcales bacterium]
MPRPRLAPTVIAGALGVAPAVAHSPPSELTTDRYLKVTPMGDRVRLAYTIVYGQVQGAALRRQLDRDRDGRIADAEAEVLGEQLDRQVATDLHLAIDGRALRWEWSRVDVGLGTDAVAAGALSVDLIAWLCTGGGATHALAVRDDVRLEAMGTSELTIEVGPGVEVEGATLGGEPMPDTVATWTGVGGPIATGFELRYAVDARAARPKDGRCHADAGAGPRRWWPYALAATVAALAAAAFLARHRHRRR